jgi:hypothetical protein
MEQKNWVRLGLLIGFGAVLTAVPAQATPFIIDLSFGAGLTTMQRDIFSSAASTWMGLLPSYRPGISISQLTINANARPIDGVGGILGSAGPDSITNQGGFRLATNGSMDFDTADIANLESTGRLLAVVLHEIAHVIGFGTLWTNNNVYIDDSGQYTGANALAAYRTEFNQLAAAAIPVELGGGSGTADGHWDEVDGGGANTGRVSSFGDMRFELMTGWINSSYYISNTTIQSFADIGYLTTPIPEPATLFSFSAGASLLFLLRRRGE